MPPNMTCIVPWEEKPAASADSARAPSPWALKHFSTTSMTSDMFTRLLTSDSLK